MKCNSDFVRKYCNFSETITSERSLGEKYHHLEFTRFQRSFLGGYDGQPLMMLRKFFAAYSFVLLIPSNGNAIETLGFERTDQLGEVEVRNYERHLRASVDVDGSFKDAGNAAFRPLFRYISGRNAEEQDIAMTAPVIQSASRKDNAAWTVSFVMPASLLKTGAPRPDTERVEIVEVPEQLIAALTYSGSWRVGLFEENKKELIQQLERSPYSICGEVMWARHNAPFTPWFLKKNEVLVPVCRE